MQTRAGQTPPHHTRHPPLPANQRGTKTSVWLPAALHPSSLLCALLYSYHIPLLHTGHAVSGQVRGVLVKMSLGCHGRRLPSAYSHSEDEWVLVLVLIIRAAHFLLLEPINNDLDNWSNIKKKYKKYEMHLFVPVGRSEIKHT